MRTLDLDSRIPSCNACIVVRASDLSFLGLSKEGTGVDSTVLHAIQTRGRGDILRRPFERLWKQGDSMLFSKHSTNHVFYHMTSTNIADWKELLLFLVFFLALFSDAVRRHFQAGAVLARGLPYGPSQSALHDQDLPP